MERNEDIFAIARAFMRSRIILTAAELDLFSLIEDGDCTSAKIALRRGLDERAVSRVLDCLVTFGLLEKAGENYSTTEEGSAFASKHPDSSLPMLLHMGRLWDSWSGLTETVEKGPASNQRLPKPLDPRDRQAFIGAMHVIGRTLSEEIAQSLDLGRFKKLIDIGGGSGTYTIAFLKRHPHLRAVLFDLEAVVSMARERMASEGFPDRTELVAGDFYRDELPTGCDLALLSAIIHQNDPEQNLDLYGKIFRALDPGGMLVIRDHIMDETRTRPPEGALFAINMLVNTRGGDTYTFEEVRADLVKVGFINVRMLRSGERMDCLIGADKPR
ncbi:MAG: methyltransferase [Syntrophobacteraceae bacterium]